MIKAKENFTVVSDTQLETMKDLVRIQSSDGNWNYDPYMHGMYNGMVLMLANIENKAPAFREAPLVWKKDLPVTIGVDHAAKGSR